MSSQEHINGDNTLLRAHEPLDDETGWLIEEDASGVICWIALTENAWPRTELRDRRLGARSSLCYERYLSPVRRVKDASEALRFARKQDAEAFIKLFDRFLLCPIATEHCWAAIAMETGTATAPQSDVVAKP